MDLFLVFNWPLEPVIKDRSQLLAEKKEEPKKEESLPATNTPPSPLVPRDIRRVGLRQRLLIPHRPRNNSKPQSRREEIPNSNIQAPEELQASNSKL